MKVVIKYQANSYSQPELVLVLPVEYAAAAATLLAHATVYRPKSYPHNEHYDRCDSGLVMEYDSTNKFAETDPAILAAEAAKSKAESERYTAQADATKAKKELADLQSKLDLLRSVTVCRVESTPADPIDTDEN